ncbi:DUF6114 domain-containing protein [Natrinema ejinorense]|uniref:DUF6114 domain-containing protein n=1 Tax=Natrinema ejinorense TaxID=373386 RepID=UPI001B801C5F|nr:DUF6114 domain-containing protein [Natrinema ejinorense]
MIDDRRSRFADWRRERPFWGGIVLTLAGLVIAAVPLDLVIRFAMVRNYVVFVGLVLAVPVLVSGLLSLAYPQYATYFGAVGIAFAIVSIFGALGGLGIGTFLGMVGGSLCIAWVPADAATDGPSGFADAVPTRIRSWCRGVVDSLA